MIVSRTYLEQHARETGFPLATLEKVVCLGSLASAVATHHELREALALKGGTAFNLCFGESPPRLSVDLDYNYIGSEDRESMLTRREEIEATIVGIAERLDFRVQLSAHSFAGRKVFARFRSVLGPESRVEVDLNYLWRSPLAGTIRRSLWQPGALQRPAVLCVSLAELCVGKVLAFLDRSAPRDAFDIVTLARNAPEVLRGESFRGLFIAFSALLPHPLYTYSRKTISRRLSQAHVEGHLLPMLAATTAVDSNGLTDAAWNIVSPLLDLTPPERAYLDHLERGDIRADLLFPGDASLADQITRHPVIRWKTHNVRQRRG